MVIFFYGQDGYRLRQDLEKIVNEYNKKNTSGMSFSILDFAEQAQTELAKLEDLIKTTTFFNEKRLIVLKNPFRAGEKIIDLIDTWDLPADKQRILIFTENLTGTELSRQNKKLFGLLSAKPNLVKNFEPLDVKKLEQWAGKEIEGMGMRIKPDALAKLVYFTVGTTNKKDAPAATAVWQIHQEINKLANYKSALSAGDLKDKMISVSDVQTLVTPPVELNIFEVLDAFAKKNKLASFLSLHKHLENGTDPHYIFSMLVYQFRNLLRVKSLADNAVPYAGIVKKTGLNPFVVKKTYEHCRNFELDELKQLFSQLTQLEIGTKAGSSEMADGLYGFVFSLS